MRHVSRTHRVALGWLFDRISVDPKIQIKYIDTKNQLGWYWWPREISRVMSGIICCACINISNFSSTSLLCCKWPRNDFKKIQEKSESQQNQNLWWILLRGRRRTYRPRLQKARGRRSYGSQDPWSSIAEEDRSRRPDKGTDLFGACDHYNHEQFMESFSSASYSKWDDERAWSSQEWKTEIKTYERSGRPDETSWKMIREVRPGHEEILLDGTTQSVRNGEPLRDRSGRSDNINSQEVANSQKSVMGTDETELELSVESRSFVNRVNDQARKRQKKFQCYRRWRRTFYDLVNVYGCNNGISGIHQKELPKQSEFHCVNTTDLTLKQVFDISTKLVSEHDEISCLEKIGWEKHSWKYLSFIGDERIINLQRTIVYVFSDSVLCLGKIHQNQDANEAWKKRIEWSTTSQSVERTKIARGFILLTRRTRNSKKPSRMLVRNWKHPWLSGMPCKIVKKNCGSGGSNKIQTKLACLLEADESTRLRMEEFITKSSWRPYCRKSKTIHYSFTIWFTNLFPCLEPWRFPKQRQQWTRSWKNEEKIRRGTWQVRSKSEVIDEARTLGAKVHFASSMDICHLKNAELEAIHQKSKGRVVLRGDIVTDDPGSFAVFTEQGSSASQMTAAKIMDIISRLLGCDGQAADAVSAYT